MITSKRLAVTIVSMIALLVSMCLPAVAAGKDRTVDAGLYSLSFDKQGRLSVTLADGKSVASGVVAVAQLARQGESLVLGGRKARIERFTERDSLGEATVLHVECDEGLWQLRAYADQPFFTARMTFKNTGAAPVAVRTLSPFVADQALGGGYSLGPDTNRAPVLDGGSLTNPMAELHDADTTKITSLWNAAVCNPQTDRLLVVAFLTTEHGYPQVRIVRDEDRTSGQFAEVTAECLYDSPVEVPAGGELVSETAYIAVAESNGLDGLGRFAKSVAAINDLHPLRNPLPHGWDPWSTEYQKDINEAKMIAALDAVDTRLKRYGWSHFSIDAGWERATGDWRPDPEKFPHGMKWMADQIHARGMTAGLWTDPFSVKLGTPVAEEHPDWLVGPNGMGRIIVPEDERILDVTIPAVAEYIANLYRTIRRDWGYDVLIEIDFTYHLMMAEAYAQGDITRAEVMHRGLRLIREAFGDDGFIMGVSPLPITGLMADGMRIGLDCAPVWKKTPDIWSQGCVNTLTNAAKRFYFCPDVFAMDQDCAFFGHRSTRARWHVSDKPELTFDQGTVWMTGAALTGGVLKIGEKFDDLSDREVGVLRRLLPVMPRSARPVDLFERDDPRIWSLPIDCAIGQWHVVAVFNWDADKAQTIPLSLERLGLDPDAEYTLFDFWPGEYDGRVKGSVDLDVKPGTVRVLGLRKCEGRPMFLATDSHFSQGATDGTVLEWRAADRVLEGAFDAVENTDYVLHFLVPEEYTLNTAEIAGDAAKTERNGEVVRLSFHSDSTGPVRWRLAF